MAIGYGLEGIQPLKLAKALRRVYDDPNSIDNPNRPEVTEEEESGGRAEKLKEYGLKDAVMRRGSFIVDVKRKSLSRPGETFARYDDAGMVAEAMVSLGVDVVFVNVDYHSYGGMYYRNIKDIILWMCSVCAIVDHGNSISLHSPFVPNQ